MIEAEKTKFMAAVVGLAEFYGVDLNKMSLDIYWDTLREHELETVEEAHAVPHQRPGFPRIHFLGPTSQPSRRRWLSPASRRAQVRRASVASAARRGCGRWASLSRAGAREAEPMPMLGGTCRATRIIINQRRQPAGRPPAIMTPPLSRPHALTHSPAVAPSALLPIASSAMRS